MIICVDAGHGGHDRGGQSLGPPEAEIALDYANELARVLTRMGHQVVKTRDVDVFIPLTRRAVIANEARADLFVSMHANASGNKGVSGPWTIHAKGSKRGKAIATIVQEALVRVFGGDVEAVFPDESPWVGNRRLAVLRRTAMPAVLVELGFMTNAKDIEQLRDDALRMIACHAIGNALHESLTGSEWVEPAPRPKSPNFVYASDEKPFFPAGTVRQPPATPFFDEGASQPSNPPSVRTIPRSRAMESVARSAGQILRRIGGRWVWGRVFGKGVGPDRQ